ncbi:MAG TPA: hypothetical protein VG755_24835 [Nannocystaceae bacterium]|nr:hypothetical protein [Nannocystaceae bacterium]
MRVVGWLLAGIGLVATIQGVAWIGAADAPRGRVALGVLIACAGIFGTGGGVAHALLPELFAG